MTQTKPQNVYAKIAAVQTAIAKEGIGKTRKNLTPGQNYNFRGIDEVYNALSPIMAANGLCILPRIVGRELIERRSAKGNPLFTTIVEAEFDFVSADDGSTHTVRTYGEAMDSSDKSTNKAMSAAYKYAALMTFAIPTEGDNDADATTHEVAADKPAKPKPATITEAQLEELQLLSNHLGVNLDPLLKLAKIDALTALPAPWFDRAKAWVNEQAKAAREAPKSLADELDDGIDF